MPEDDDARRICGLCGYVGTNSDIVCPTDGAVLKMPASEGLVGKVIADKYKVLARIGSGGMGSVYKAQHLKLNQVVALKVLHGYMGDDEPERIKRFNIEGRVIAQLNHPYIVRASDFDLFDGSAYLVMEYVEGKSLHKIIDESPLDERRAVAIFCQICEATAYAHGQGIVHRDLKPSNIMLTRNDRGEESIKLLDFGMVKVLNPSESQMSLYTESGIVFGSPLYMSPEQCLGQALDARSDIYGLGCVMYETLTGFTAMTGENSLDVLQKQIKDMPLPFSELYEDLPVSPAIESVVFKALQKSPDHRYGSMLELKTDLQQALHDGTFRAQIVKKDVASSLPAEKPPRDITKMASAASVLALALGALGLIGWQMLSTPVVAPSAEPTKTVPVTTTPSTPGATQPVDKAPKTTVHAPSNKVDELSHEADELLDEGKIGAAKRKFDEAIQLKEQKAQSKSKRPSRNQTLPGKADELELLAAALRAQGKPLQAQLVLQRARQIRDSYLKGADKHLPKKVKELLDRNGL